MHGDGFGCLHTEDISGHISSCSRSFFRPFISRSFFYLAFRPFISRFVLLAFSFSSCSRSFFHPARVLSFLSSCSRSFFRPFISCSFFFFLPARVLFFVLLEFIFLNKSPSKICIYQKFVVPLHSNLNTLVRD